jgi:hypothetical protein
MSRSKLYTTAIARYVEAHRNAGVTERLNEVYGQAEDLSLLDPVINALQFGSLPRDEW